MLISINLGKVIGEQDQESHSHGCYCSFEVRWYDYFATV